MTPAAPALFSTITVVCSRLPSDAAIARATTSLLAPAENGTTILITFGNAVCAGDATAMPSHRPTHRKNRTGRARIEAPLRIGIEKAQGPQAGTGTPSSGAYCWAPKMSPSPAEPLGVRR